MQITGLPVAGKGFFSNHIGKVKGDLFLSQELRSLTIRVSKSYNKVMGEIKSTKAGYWRNVPMSPELRSLLLDLKK